jgi:Zn-dependent protease/CBS domain-containing protein
MFGRKIKLFNLLGFQVNIDLSWIIIAVLITWSLADSLFPQYFKNLSRGDYWAMGAFGALGLFVSIVFHEFCHSLVARRFGMEMKGITLFIFGGVAEMGEEPPSAKAEFSMAIAGPLSSIFIGVVFYLVYALGVQSHWPLTVNGVLIYLAFINGLLAVFNLLPAFPLDGGRVLRSILWGIKDNLRWATRISSEIGAAFGILLIVLGVFQFLQGNIIGGFWWFLIGMFLQSAARMSYQQLLVRKALEGEPVRRFMNPNPITVSPDTKMADLVENYIYKYHYKFFPVMSDGKLVGCITTRQVQEVPRDRWGTTTVGEVTTQCSTENTVSPQTDAVKALSIMNQTGVSRLMVMDQDRLIGIVSLKDLMKFLSLKVELEEKQES